MAVVRQTATPQRERVPVVARMFVGARMARFTLSERLRRRLADSGSDRGEGPVSTAIMVALIAAVAVFVGGVILTVATFWTNEIPDTNP